VVFEETQSSYSIPAPGTEAKETDFLSVSSFFTPFVYKADIRDLIWFG
jgi:hypothetical protein